MAEIVTHPYTKWQKSRPILIPELKNCDPSEQHLRTRHFLGVNPKGLNNKFETEKFKPFREGFMKLEYLFLITRYV